MTRRDFIKSMGFTFFFTTLIAGTAVLGIKGRDNFSLEKCVNDYICRGCGLVSECGLPQALSYKKATGKEGG